MMGSLAGHVIPGTFFILYGLIWSILSIWIHIVSASKPRSPSSPTKKSQYLLERGEILDEKLKRRSWLPLCICPNFPLEPILKIVLPSLAIFIEAFLDYSWEGGEQHVVWRLYKVYDEHGVVRDQAKLHHITMHCGFVLSGIVDILVMFVRFPAYTSKIVLSLAFSIECILFYLHTEGRDHLNIQIHSILVFVIFICLIFSLLRLASSSNLAINLGFSGGLLLQGTWLVQAGYFLFSSFLAHRRAKTVEEREHRDHALEMFFAETFAWHVFLVAVFHLVLYVLVSLIVGSKGSSYRSPSSYSAPVDVEECRNLMRPQGNKLCQGEESVEMKKKTQT